MSKGYRLAVVVGVLLGVLAVGIAVRSAYQIAHQCVKQCDWGDKRCADMCGARHFCPAHPDGL